MLPNGIFKIIGFKLIVQQIEAEFSEEKHEL